MSIYEMIKEIINFITAATIHGICISFWILLIAEVWKWLWGIIKAFIFDLFPTLKKNEYSEGDES